MRVIFERISKKVSEQDLINFMQPVLDGHFYQESGQLEAVKIMRWRNESLEVVRYYGLVVIPSDKVAKRIIRKLNNKILKDRRVTVRKYHLRSWRNDPRINSTKFNDALENKREKDRRELNLEEKKYKSKQKIMITGDKSFYRSL